MQRVRDVRQQILASMQAHQGLVSCIRRFPPEILSEIFVRCLPLMKYTEPKTETAPLLLMGVCRGWRKVALGTPRLWCSLVVEPRYWRLHQDLLFYHHWLSRARGCPLSLAFDMRQAPKNPVWRKEVTELLQPYTSRAIRPVKGDVEKLLLKDVPMLEHLMLERVALEGDLHKDLEIEIVQPEPRLRSLTLKRIVFSAGVRSAFENYWTHLAYLRVRLSNKHLISPDIDGPVVLTLLALCPHLQDFVFSSVDVPRYDVARYAARALTHANLRSLGVTVWRGTHFFLDAITLPALRHLQIKDPYSGPSRWRHAFRSFVARSQCPLETLKIHSRKGTSEKDQAAYVALIPTLKHVDLCLVTQE